MGTTTKHDAALWLKMLAPYLAVGVFWCGLHSGWLAILAYHAQVLFWARGKPYVLSLPPRKRVLGLAILAALGGPLAYFLLPVITRIDLAVWLAQYQLTGWSFMAMIPYFGLIHPCLEQRHWADLRDATPLAHLMFAGYHMLVLYSLVSWPWLILCFAVLASASWMWQRLHAHFHSPVIPVLSHMLADTGIMVAAWLRL
jgi:hypothetical protein